MRGSHPARVLSLIVPVALVLAVIRKLWLDGKITIDNLEQLDQDLMVINFRVTR